jgi:hypothetical protein
MWDAIDAIGSSLVQGAKHAETWRCGAVTEIFKKVPCFLPSKQRMLQNPLNFNIL